VPAGVRIGLDEVAAVANSGSHMPHIPGLVSRRVRSFGLFLTLALALALAAGGLGCSGSEPITAVPSADPVAAPPQRSVASFAATPFGLFALPVERYGSFYTGGHYNPGIPDTLLPRLATIRAAGARAVVTLVGAPNKYTNADGTFNFALWKSRVDRYRTIDLSSYIDDGTIIAHYLIDQPNCASCWGGKAIPQDTVEAMAQYSKSIWPTLPTVARADATWLKGRTADYVYLDAGWAQFVARKGTAGTYLADNVAAAQAKGLQLIVGLNLIGGGATGGQMTAAEIADYGATMLSSAYPCAFISYQYDATYLAPSDIQAAMATLQASAQSRSATSCGRAGPTPPPDDSLPPPPDDSVPPPPPPPPPPSAQDVTLGWPSPADISYGTALSAAQLNATASAGGQSVAGSFSYQPGAGTVLPAGSGQTLSVTFTPDDPAAFNSATATVQLTVLKATASVTFQASTLSQIYDGKAKQAGVSVSPAGAASGVAVAYAQNGQPVAAPTNAGAYQATATLSDPNYQADAASGTLTIAPVAPAISWPVPAAITVGTALGSTQLNASARGVSGSALAGGAYLYTPAAGTKLDAGVGQLLSVRYTPADPNYVAATATVPITVRYAYSGFLQPVDNPSVLNTAKAGVAIPVRFSLNGNQGLTVMAAGSPAVRAISCPKGKTDAIEETVSATASSLIYESASARYAYIWKTDAGWAGSCQSLLITLKDGTQHEALFKFSR
jgi:hypothetical protein